MLEKVGEGILDNRKKNLHKHRDIKECSGMSRMYLECKKDSETGRLVVPAC